MARAAGKGIVRRARSAMALPRSGGCPAGLALKGEVRRTGALRPKTAGRRHLTKGEVARPAGLEPATLGLEGRCSIHLSYGRVRDQNSDVSPASRLSS